MLITDLLCQYCDYGKKYHMYLNRANSEKMGKTAYHIPSHTIAALTVFTFFAYVKYPVIPPQIGTSHAIIARRSSVPEASSISLNSATEPNPKSIHDVKKETTSMALPTRAKF